ncbi:glycosyltransferase [Novosphingobium sp.]|uniref:glycosyltransferase family 4 protein n=1 Tax=Novosphingobium sp. TaxID=1874826 RepID=UPI0026178059|nr:glycosyltransferase [Novosphingobium sp.]
MRILTVTHFYPAHGGGIERVAEHLCRELAGQGHACSWAASASDPVPDAPWLTAVPLPCANPTEALTGLPMPIPGPRGLARLIRAVRRADGVIIHDALYVTSIVAMVAARMLGRRTVLVQHIAGLPFRSAAMRAVMRLATWLVTRPMLRAADRAVFISAAVRDAFPDLRARSAPMVVFNGVDSQVFHPGDPAAEDPGAAEAAGPVLFVGRFVPKKGLAVIRACAEARPDLAFVLIGAGPLDPAAWGLPNVRTTGLLPPAAIAAQMRAARVLLLPSTGEGYPLVIQEALACGLPVICGEDSAAADPAAAPFLYPARVDPADPAGTAARVLPLLDAARADAAQRRAMGAFAAGRYSWAGMAKAISGALLPAG